MTCMQIEVNGMPGVLCVGDCYDYRIVVDGRQYHFEFNNRFGALPTNKDGSARKTRWVKRVWDAVQKWVDQGKELDDDGLCVWEEEEDEF